MYLEQLVLLLNYLTELPEVIQPRTYSEKNKNLLLLD